jgi:hypothetical protein
MEAALKEGLTEIGVYIPQLPYFMDGSRHLVLHWLPLWPPECQFPMALNVFY